jgi:hypothetical protein
MGVVNYVGAQVVHYIHLNPVEAGLVRESDSYAWSSHRFYLRRSKVPEWLRIDEVMGELSSIAQFHEFVLAANDKALERFYKNGRRSPVLGDEEFRNGLMEKPIRVDREHPRYERVAVRPSIDQVLKALGTRYGLMVEDLMKGKRGEDNEPRKHVSGQLALRSEAKGDRRTIWGRELWRSGLDMSRSRLEVAGRPKVSQTCKRHPPNLPTKDLTPVGPITYHFGEVGHALLFDEKPLADAAAGFTCRFWLERIPRASLLRTVR